MSAWALLIAVTIVPGLLWVWYFYRKDIFEPEPKLLVLKVFGYGMLGVFAAALIESGIRDGLDAARNTGDLIGLFFYAFIGIGLVEEGVKMAILWISAYRSRDFNEIMDGIIYGITVGLGFAALENLFYARTWGIWVALSRAILTCLAHALFSGIAGFHMALGKFSPGRRMAHFARALFVTAFWHGAYDFLLLSPFPTLRFGSLAVVLLLAYSLGRKITLAQQFSPFRRDAEGDEND